MPDEISGMGKTHGKASLLCKNILDFAASNTGIYYVGWSY
jgi:hypothetical protein